MKKLTSALAAAFILLAVSPVTAFAHGGNHHGARTAPVQSAPAQSAPVYAPCQIAGCTLTDNHQHGEGWYCGHSRYDECQIDGCTIAGQHQHDNEWYCGHAAAVNTGRAYGKGHHSGGHHSR